MDIDPCSYRDIPWLPSRYVERWQTVAKENVALLNKWIGLGLLAPVDPHHLLLSIWLIAQLYISQGWQMPRLPGTEALDTVDYEAAADTAIQLFVSRAF